MASDSDVDRRTLLKGVGAGTVGMAAVTSSAAGDETPNTRQSTQTTCEEDANSDGPTLLAVDVATAHGPSAGEYTPVDTVYTDDPFYVVGSVKHINHCGSIRLRFDITVKHGLDEIIGTNHYTVSENPETGDNAWWEVWPEFSTSQEGPHTAIVTVTDVVLERSRTGTVDFTVA